METLACASCGTGNRPGRRFCRACGAELGVVCPACGTVNEAGDRFCGSCGTALEGGTASAIAGSGASPPGAQAAALPNATAATVQALERRLVTVLFADLVGSTEMAEGQDPETVRDALGRYYDLCREIVRRYGGEIEKFIGDAVMAVWGTPVAHEDDAERAVRAALDLVDAARGLRSPAGEPLAVRAGVLTGEAAVAVGAEGQALVAGDVVNTASRLQGAAAAGTVLVGEATVRGSEAAIDYEEAGERQLKGKLGPVRAWRALRVAAGRLGSGRVNRLEPPFVGRDDELRLLKEVFHQTARERRARLVSITGIAGIGKSRLAWELEKYLDGLAETVYWHQGRSPAYGEGLAFWALGEMIRGRARIAETDDASSARAKLAAMTTEYLPDAEERARVEPRLAALLGLDPAPSGGAEELTGAWRTLFERVADLGPTVLVFEDLHWADDGLLDFIETLLAGARSKPIFVVALARPELMSSRPTWGAAVRNHLRLDLAPLDRDAMKLLLVGLAPGIPPAAIEAISDRAEGVPLYAVETVRMLLDQGRLTESEGRYRLAGPLAGLAVPDSLQALLGSRLDALDPAARDLVGHCAVLGLSFTVGSLATIAGRPEADVRSDLDALVDRELLTFDDDPRSPERGQYRFLQAVLREVAYGRLSRRERFVRHRAVARAFEAAVADELAGVVATHYLEAYRAAPDDERATLRPTALAALEAAADRSRSIGAHASAARYLEDAIDLASGEDERVRLRERRLGDLYWTPPVGQQAEEVRALVRIARDRGDLALLARAAYLLAGVLSGLGTPGEAVREAGAIRDELGDFATTDPDGLRLTAEVARCHLMSGQPAEAAVLIEATLPAVERLGLRETVAELLASKGWSIGAQERPIEAMSLLRGALAFAERNDFTRAEIRARMNLTAFGSLEDLREGFEVARDGVERARRRGYDTFAVALAGNASGNALLLGEWDWIERMVQEFGLDERDEPWQQAPRLSQAEILAFRGDFHGARALTDRVAAVTTDDPQLSANLHNVLATIAFTTGDLATAAAESELETVDLLRSGTHEDLDVGFIAMERRDADRLRLTASRGRGGRLRDAILDAFTAAADVIDGEAGGLGRIDATADLLEANGGRFVAAMLRRGRAMLVPDDPGAAEAARSAAAVFTELGALTMLRGIEGPLGPSEVAALPPGVAVET